ncbi:hypothetical protein [Jeotgalibacillus haloalkalitolerans]|uniref:Lipoprotein n=1 Tax=Jeotgalibacillus haloalkalitolerans TaxID=3104292 RepID=A0ABU5KJD4_9BACL|nr:hypothetical protein [Jeotgalibacillus sp. HH7-29]MDZ5711369.1 hypothetical protein [Jeotgalibacillus sp. HH7-29]
MFKRTFLLTAGVLLVTGCSSTNSSDDMDVKEETQSSVENSSDYHAKVEALQEAMMEAGIKAEEMTDQYYSVWYDVIYEDEVQIGGNVAKDFDTALYYQYIEFSDDGSIEELEELMASVETQISDLKSPPAEYQQTYDTQLEMYLSLKALSSLAIEPSGSLDSFTDDISRLVDEMLDANNKYTVQLPDSE